MIAFIASRDYTWQPTDLCLYYPLQTLGLEDNEIKDWAEVCKLSRMPHLQRLMLGGNKLKEIHYPKDGGEILLISLLGKSSLEIGRRST